MSRFAAFSVIIMWVGSMLLLSEMRWFRRLPLVERLRPFEPGGLRAPSTRSGASRSFNDVLAPLAATVGERVSRGFGVSEELTLRLERVHSRHDVGSFRMRQLIVSLAGLAAATLLALAMQPPAPVVLLVVAIGPLVGFLATEQQLARESERHQRRLFLELPIVAEQLGMLLSSGYSVNAALARVTERGDGACTADLARVNHRIQHGLATSAALDEWARVADVGAVHQLVSVLTLHQETSDLGQLISTEARSIRRAQQRELLERIERRNQQVWVPVTVATLVPGVIFLAVPFMSALSGFSAL